MYMSATNILTTDCCIIGCGPTGLMLGLKLLKQGKRVCVFDKHKSQLTFSRAILINSDTIKLLNDETGLKQSLLGKGGIPVNGMSITINEVSISRANFDCSNNSEKNHPICLPQLRTENCLLEAFIEAGGIVLRGYVFNAKDQEQQQEHQQQKQLEVILRSYPETNCEKLICQTTWLFGCDGFHSQVRKYLDIDYIGTTLAETGVAYDVDLSPSS